MYCMYTHLISSAKSETQNYICKRVKDKKEQEEIKKCACMHA